MGLPILVPPVDPDLALREAAIRHCRLLSLQWGEAVPYAELARGFPFGGAWIKLVGPQGVFKPKEMSDGPLTLLSTLASTYADEPLEGDEVLYDYAPRSREYENDGLKRIASQGKAVILLMQVKSKPRPEYMVFAPVVMLGFDDAARKVRLNLAAAQMENADVPSPAPSVFSKAYAETAAKARLHQAKFRKATLAAYAERCCVCELRERPPARRRPHRPGPAARRGGMGAERVGDVPDASPGIQSEPPARNRELPRRGPR